MRWHCATWTCSLFTFTHILTYSICQSNVVERLNIALYGISNISIGRKGRVCTIYNVANCYWIKVNDDFFSRKSFTCHFCNILYTGKWSKIKQIHNNNISTFIYARTEWCAYMFLFLSFSWPRVDLNLYAMIEIYM